jgi:hypothetical protein
VKYIHGLQQVSPSEGESDRRVACEPSQSGERLVVTATPGGRPAAPVSFNSITINLTSRWPISISIGLNPGHGLAADWIDVLAGRQIHATGGSQILALSDGTGPRW